ncbi:MAG: hypothetical protein KC544_08000 [Gemmatimonadetes bacterium]|nr:hypothetical protein [Gemmatimonadota bacterium]MCA9769727.1 hypothetical protein [Gemmatimonadota bacterium]MCB9519193.1 hypothetical protein [Gemmatimonadales bacterium]HRY09972.1 hypothetical protein [Candidatus Nanopelagicales bacterium]
MKQVYMARDRVDAERACSALRGVGFAAVVVGDLVAIPSATFPSVWVPDEQADAAAAAWADLRGPGASAV